MNIYFACSITGGRKDEDTYTAIVSALLEQGHHIPTAGLADSRVIQLEGNVDPVKVYERDTGWIMDCEVLIAEVSTPSHGVGYEIGYALQLSKPVICIYQKGTTVSKMIIGNKDPNMESYGYKSIKEAIGFVHTRLAEIAKGILST